ncbi:MAG TPA: ABC transporter substrate-binding protein [Nitrososphaeraceae archaeon]|jgi:NitT/TauT family transport system substrate-binding protein
MDFRIKLGISAGIIFAVMLSSIIYSAGPSSTSSGIDTKPSNGLRIGYFPNLNHAQALIGLETGSFQRALGDSIKIDSKMFSAGPSLIEALFANQIDVAYVGPNPTINGYVVSDGNGLKVISGAASGGAVFVVRNESGINSRKDLDNRIFASPQLGNTQDVALRKYIIESGFKTKDNGGNVTVVQATPSDILTLFLKKQIDGAWVPEPWGARLVKEAGGRILVDERSLWPDGKFITANIIARSDYLKNNPDIIKKFLSANIDETIWLNKNKNTGIKLFNQALKNITGRTIQQDELTDAWSRLTFTYDPIKSSLLQSANSAYDLGFLAKGKERPNLSGLYDLTILNNILNQRSLQKIK